MMTDKVLLKDIVIKAGTVFRNVDDEEREFAEDNYACTVGLTKNTAGEIIYGIDPDFHEIKRWFRDVE
jgi:hypothetical protein